MKNRDAILKKLRSAVKNGDAVIVCGAGTGLFAHAAAAGGADIIIGSMESRCRADGHDSLKALMPMFDANKETVELGKHLVPVADGTPVVAGLAAWDASGSFVSSVDSCVKWGYSGIANVPSVGRYGKCFREAADGKAASYGDEVALIKYAHDSGLFTMAFAFTEEDVRLMLDAGADVIVACAEDTKSLAALTAAAKSNRPDAIVLLNSRSIHSFEDAERALKETGAAGIAADELLDQIPALDGMKQAFSYCMSFE